jgi:hypothetical protein
MEKTVLLAPEVAKLLIEQSQEIFLTRPTQKLTTDDPGPVRFHGGTYHLGYQGKQIGRIHRFHFSNELRARRNGTAEEETDPFTS